MVFDILIEYDVYVPGREEFILHFASIFDRCSKLSHKSGSDVALAYLLSTEELWPHVDKLFDFENGWINPEGLSNTGLAGGELRLASLAFNLWNGYRGEDAPIPFTPADLLGELDSETFWLALDAMRLRYKIKDRPWL